MTKATNANEREIRIGIHSSSKMSACMLETFSGKFFEQSGGTGGVFKLLRRGTVC